MRVTPNMMLHSPAEVSGNDEYRAPAPDMADETCAWYADWVVIEAASVPVRKGCRVNSDNCHMPPREGMASTLRARAGSAFPGSVQADLQALGAWTEPLDQAVGVTTTGVVAYHVTITPFWV